MKLLAELSRIDYLPRDYVFNVANALKRKRRENPRLNTEALPGSEVLVSLLERTGTGLQRDVMRNLEASSPDSARNVKGKLVSIETLRYLRDGQLLEVVLSLRHDELLQFLKAAPPVIRDTVFAKSPRELTIELEEELANTPVTNRETYFAIERKILNRMKLMANEGLINLVETNERMFTDAHGDVTMNIQNGAIVGSITPNGASRKEAG
jgi:flagellar motor switch protein FliG